MENSLTPNKETNDRTETVIYAVYYLMLLAMLAASFYPAYRVWGFNHWAYYPSYVAIILFCVGAVLPFALSRFRFVRGVEDADAGKRKSKFLTVAGILIIVYVAMFYLLRAETHFLGDGYLILSNLPDVNPWVKLRNLGEELIHKAVYSLLSGSGWSRSLLSYQLVSYMSGLILLLSAALASARLFSRFSDRVLFFLGLTSSGYMLLFFGYVENYSVFVTSVMIYTLIGLLILTGRVSRWYVLIPMHAAFATHAFGMALIPSALFLLMSGRTFEGKLLRLSTAMKTLLVSVVVVVCGAAFLYFYNSSYFFRFAVVPLMDNRFTVEGYTLFSVKHLLDNVNLLILLLPGLPLLAVVTLLAPVKNVFAGRENLFLLILTLSALGVVFIFDPKLGMPRDWDLFSFWGVPLAVWGYYLVVKNRSLSSLFSKAAVMAIFLGLVVLIPRAVGRAGRDIELSHVENYTRLDIKKTNNLSWLIRDHYAQRGDTATTRLLYQRWLMDFPEHELVQKGIREQDEGRFYEAIGYFRLALEANPMHSPTYQVLGACYTQVGHYDSAMAAFAIADGMNPNSALLMVELARHYRLRSQMDKSEEYFKRALKIEPENMDASLGLLELYWTSQQVGKHDELLIEVARHPGAPPGIHKRLGDMYISQNLVEQAATQYRIALEKGLDSTQLEALRARFPQLSL